MKTNLLLALLLGSVATVPAQGTAFTYQGRLDENGNPVNGQYDLRFLLHTAETGSSQIGPSLTNSAVVSNGLFTVTLDFGVGVFDGAPRWIEIGAKTNGAAIFATLPRQLLTAAPYAVYSGAVPAAGVVGTLVSGQLASGSVTSTQIVSAAIAPNHLNLPGFNTTFWRVSGNSGTTAGTHFIGTSDNQPLEFKVNNQRALRFEPNSGAPNVIGGSPLNQTGPGVVGATISGGGALDSTNSVLANFGTIGGGVANSLQAGANGSTIAGGGAHVIRSPASTIGGGEGNLIESNGLYATINGGAGNIVSRSGRSAAIGGGEGNVINPSTAHGTIAGGVQNSVGAAGGTVGGGANNIVETNSSYAVIPGGRFNKVSGEYGFAAGRRAEAQHTGAFVWADSHDTAFASTTSNQFNVRASGGVRFITGGAGLNVDGQPLGASSSGGSSNWSIGTTTFLPVEFRVNDVRAIRIEPTTEGAPNVISGSEFNSVASGIVGASIAGGGAANFGGTALSNTVASHFGSIGGGAANVIHTASDQATISGGKSNVISQNAQGATIGGGQKNVVQAGAPDAAISGGNQNQIKNNAPASTIAGGQENVIDAGAIYGAVAGGFRNQVNVGAIGAAIGGGLFNTNGASYGTVGGGCENAVDTGATNAAVGGGVRNVVRAQESLIGGGKNNEIQQESASGVIAGGSQNKIEFGSQNATVSGGLNNSVKRSNGSIGGGSANTVDGANGTVGGGAGNLVKSSNATVSGGLSNSVQGAGANVSGGELNEIQLNASHGAIGGGLNNRVGASAVQSTIAGGGNNRIADNTSFATIPGGQGALATHYGQVTHASGSFATPGDAQTSSYLLRGTSTDTNLTELFLDGVSQRLIVPTNSAWMYELVLVTGNDIGAVPVTIRAGGLKVTGFFVRLAGGSLHEISDRQELGNVGATGVEISPNAQGEFRVTVQGRPSSTARWLALVRTVEIALP